jgi:hypothetical protein
MVVPPAPVVQVPIEVPQDGVLVGRGLGLLDMARSIRAGRPHVATGRFGYHVLDTLLSIEESVEARQFVPVSSSLDEVGSLTPDFDPLAATL